VEKKTRKRDADLAVGAHTRWELGTERKKKASLKCYAKRSQRQVVALEENGKNGPKKKAMGGEMMREMYKQESRDPQGTRN